MKKMYDKSRISPKSYQSKRIELDKWVSKEKENISKTRKEIEKSWMMAYDTI